LKVDVLPSDTAICEKLSLELSSKVSGSSTYTYTWAGPNGHSGNSQNLLINNIVSADNGTYRLTVSSPGCTYSVVDSSVVTVHPAPVIDTSFNNGPVCEGDTLKFFSEVSSGTGAYTFNWSGPNGFTSSEQNPYISNAPSTID
jgi:hypothetical protein